MTPTAAGTWPKQSSWQGVCWLWPLNVLALRVPSADASYAQAQRLAEDQTELASLCSVLYSRRTELLSTAAGAGPGTGAGQLPHRACTGPD